MTEDQMIFSWRNRDADDGFWLDFFIDGQPHDKLGPFESASQREQVSADFLEQMYSAGLVVRVLPEQVQ
jgi:hypothetical protein